jgi:hypothetical protein
MNLVALFSDQIKRIQEKGSSIFSQSILKQNSLKPKKLNRNKNYKSAPLGKLHPITREYIDHLKSTIRNYEDTLDQEQRYSELLIQELSKKQDLLVESNQRLADSIHLQIANFQEKEQLLRKVLTKDELRQKQLDELERLEEELKLLDPKKVN